MFFLYLTLFLVPLVLLLGLVYYRQASWLMDLNTTATIRSVLMGVVRHKSSLLQGDHDVTCFHQQPKQKGEETSNATSMQQMAKKTASGQRDASRLASVFIDYLNEDNFTLHPCELNRDVNGNQTEQRPKSLMLLFAWLFAKERHLDKYRKLYIDKGFDVLTIKVNVRDFLIPQSGSQQIAANILRFFTEHGDEYQSFVFHAFSVGAYQMGELFVMLNKEAHKEIHNKTRQRLKGLIYDSALDVSEAPLGLSKATTNNSLLQWGITMLMNAHLRLCYHISTRHYISSSRAVQENMFNCPTLVFLSKDDEVANYEHQFEVIDMWRQRGIEVVSKCWEESPHVSHYFKHPDEYRSMVDEFLRNVAKIF